MKAPKVWFITGASSGFGRLVTEEVLKNGDIAVATLRKPAALADLTSAYPDTRLLVLPLEVRDKAAVHAAFAAATEKFGRIDVVFNNAGISVMGEAEGLDKEDAKRLFDVNFWSAANVTLEAVRVFREVNSPRGGLLLQNSSQCAFTDLPISAHYCASKAALEAFSRGVQTEVDPAWNIKITLIEPGSFHTDIKGNMQLAPQHPAYTTSPAPTGLRQYLSGDFQMPGDPAKAGAVIYKLSTLSDPPLYFPLGKDAIENAWKYIDKIKKDVEAYGSWSDNVSR